MMRIKVIRIACLLLFISLAIKFTLPCYAFEYKSIPNVDQAQNVYFYNLDAKKVILKKGENEKIAPASSTKIMTGLLACEIMEDKLDQTITITRPMITAVEGTRMKLSEGDKISVRSLIYGAVCGGFNDAAYALASACCGTYIEFVKLMNERAAQLGAINTHYTNPTGYDDNGMYTTLEDVATIAKAAIKNKTYMEISSTVSKKIEFESFKDPFTVHNRNGLIGSYYTQGYVNKSAKGMIAGVTDLGGHCVITNAIVNETSYLCIVMGGKETEEGIITSYSIANDLIDYAKKNLGNITLMKAGTFVCTIPIEFALNGATQEEGKSVLNVRTAEDAVAFLPLNIDTQSKVTYRYYLYFEKITAPIRAGVIVGSLDLYCDGEYVTSVPLIVNADVSANEFLINMEKMKSAILSRTVIISIICFPFLLFLRYRITKNHRRYRNIKEIKMKRL